MALRPNAGYGLLILEVSRSHITTYHSRLDSSGRVVTLTQRPLTIHKTHEKHTPMPPVGFEPTISTGEWAQTHALDRAVTGIGDMIYAKTKLSIRKYENRSKTSLQYKHFCLFSSLIRRVRRTRWPRGLRRGAAATRLLGLRVRIRRRHGCLSLVSVVCCPVGVSALG
jgi:hypothetical protein